MTYIDEKKVETLHQAAVMADDYTLTHKASIGESQIVSTLNKNVEPFYPRDDGRRPTHSRGNARNSSRNSQYSRRHPPLPAGPECFHCHKRGHVMADCWHLKGTNLGPTKSTMTAVRTKGQEFQGSANSCLCDEYNLSFLKVM